MKLNQFRRDCSNCPLSTHPKAGGLMKLYRFIPLQLHKPILSTHPKAGGLMKPRPLKPLSREADKYIFVG